MNTQEVDPIAAEESPIGVGSRILKEPARAFNGLGGRGIGVIAGQENPIGLSPRSQVSAEFLEGPGCRPASTIGWPYA